MTTTEVNDIVKKVYNDNWFPVWKQVDRSYLSDIQTIPIKMPRIESLTEDDQYGCLPFFIYCDYSKQLNRIYQLRYIDKESATQVINLIKEE